MSKRVSPKGVTHTRCAFPQCQFTRGDRPSKPLESRIGYPQRGGAYGAEQVPGVQSRPLADRWVLASSQVATEAAHVLWSGSPVGLRV